MPASVGPPLTQSSTGPEPRTSTYSVAPGAFTVVSSTAVGRWAMIDLLRVERTPTSDRYVETGSEFSTNLGMVQGHRVTGRRPPQVDGALSEPGDLGHGLAMVWSLDQPLVLSARRRLAQTPNARPRPMTSSPMPASSSPRPENPVLARPPLPPPAAGEVFAAATVLVVLAGA